MAAHIEASRYSLKKPFIYSPTYKHWRDVVKAHGADNAEAVRLACDHSRQFAIPNERCGEWIKTEKGRRFMRYERYDR